MTVDIATLGIAVDTSGVKRAVTDLDALGNSAAKNANATRDINRAFTQFNDGLFAHERAAKAAADAEARLKMEQMALASSTPKLTEGQIHFMEALKDQATQAGKTGAELLRLKAAQLGMAEEAKPFIDQIDKAGNAVRKFSIHTAEARESMTSVVRSAMSGDVTQMTASLTTLAGRAGITSVVFTAMGAAVGGTLAAIAGGLYVLHKGEEQLQQLANVLTVTGNSAGLTADKFQSMTEKVGASSNLGQARESLLALVATGKMSVEAMEAVGQAAITMARLTGQSAAEVAGEFAKMGDGVTKYVDEFDRKYNILTMAQYEHVRALDAQGKAQEAMTAFGKYVDDALEKNKRSLTGLNKLLQEGKDAWSDFWQKAMSFDPNSTSAQIAAIEAKIAGITEKKPRAELFGISIGLSDDTLQSPAAVKYLEGLRTKLAGLRQKLQEDEAKAAAEGKLKEDERLGKEAKRTLEAMQERYGAKAAAEEKEIAKYNKAIADAMRGGMSNVPNADEQAAFKARIKAAYAEKPDTEGRALSQSAIAHAAALREIEFKARADALETRRALGDMDETNYQRAVSHIALEGIASRQLTERQMLGIAGLTESQKANHKNRIAQLDEEFKREEFRANNREEVSDKKSVDATFKAVIDDGFARTAALDAQILKQKELNAEIGLSGERVRELRAERYALDTATLENQAVEMSGHVARAVKDSQAQEVFKMRLFFLEQEIAKRRELTGMQAPLDAKANEDERASRMTAQLQNAAGAAREFGEAMGQAFGDAGAAVGGLVRAFTSYGVIQDKIAREQKQALATTKDDAKIAEINAKAAAKTASAQVNQYGDMAKAAKGFFKEGTSGYAAMETAEKTFRAIELAMAIENHLTKSGLTSAFTALFASSKASEVAAETGTLAPTVAVETAKQGVFGTTGLAAALSLPFPANIPAFAIVAAMLASIGVAVAGGGSTPNMTAENRQSQAGTGSTFGDRGVRQSDGTMKYKDKSDSIARSLDLVEQHTEIALGYSDAMLRSLRAIENSIGGLTNLAIRGGALDKASGIQTGTIKGASIGNGAFSMAGSAAIGYGLATTLMEFGSIMGPVGAAVGAVIGAVLSKAFKTKQSILDEGLKIDQQSYGDAINGVSGSTYADVNTKKSFLGISYSDKDKTVNTGALDEEMSRQFGQVVTALGDGIASAMSVLGLGGDAFTERLKTFVINIGEISTKGLSGEEIEAQFQAVFSKLGDDMARFSIDGLQQFQKVGEGYFETLMRIASNFQVVDAVLGSIGKSFGAVGTDSLIAREAFIEAAGGLEELASKTQSFAQNFLTEEERLAPVRKYVLDEMTRLGAASVTTRDQFKALVLAQDTATQAGRDMYLALLNIEQAFADTHKAAEDTARSLEDIAAERRGLQDEMDALTMTRAQLRAKERAALAQENRVLFDMLTARQDVADAYERESQALGTTIERLKQLGTTLANFLTGLDQGNLSALTPMEKMEEARRVYEDTLAKAKAGDAAAQGQITQAASNYLTADRVVNASSPTYTADFERVKADLRGLMATAGVQLSEAEKQLASMKTLTEQLVNLDDSTISLTEAINNLHAAILQMPGGGAISDLYKDVLGREPDAGGLQHWSDAFAGGTPMADIGTAFQNSPEKQVSNLYQSILGRAPDQDGLAYWTRKVEGGMTLDQVAAAFKSSNEYLDKPVDGSHATGLESVPFDGYKAELHEGEAVIDAPAMRALTRYFGAPAGSSQGGNTAALVAEIRALREEVAALRGEQERQTGQIIHGHLAASERSADKAVAGSVEAARAQAWAAQQAQKMAVK